MPGGKNEGKGGTSGQAEAAPKATATSTAADAAAGAAVPDDDEQDGLLLVGEKPGMYHCNSCQRDISQIVRIKCAECKDWDSCVDCFCAGAELEGHKAYHPYRVVDNTAFPLFTPDWTATEELNMLSAMEQHGMGNFGKVAEFLGTGTKDKGEKACMEHYTDLYMHSYGSLLPENTILRDGRTVPTSTLIPRGQRDYYSIKEATVAKYPEARYLENAPPLPSDGTRCPREKFKASKTTEKDKTQADAPVVPGYMPLRGDFDVEHEQEAELLLADMEIDPNDHPAEKELKLSVVDVYNRKLDERERRKEFVKTHNLIDYRTLQNREKRKPKDERELLAKLRIFTRFFPTPDEHDQFVQGVLEAKKLRKRIEQLQHYRRIGIRTQQEASQYEAEKKRREMEQMMKKQSATYLNETGKTGTYSARDRLNRYKKRQKGGDGDDDDGLGSASGPAALEIDEAPGVEHLSAKERDMCSMLRLLPKVYLKIKATLVDECRKKGFLHKDNVRQLISTDVSKVGHVYDFLVECNWVNPSARPELKLNDISAKVINTNPTHRPPNGKGKDKAAAPTPTKPRAPTATAPTTTTEAPSEAGDDDDAPLPPVEGIEPPLGVMREMSVDDDTPDDHPTPPSSTDMAQDPLFTAATGEGQGAGAGGEGKAEGEEGEAEEEAPAPMEVDA